MIKNLVIILCITHILIVSQNALATRIAAACGKESKYQFACCYIGPTFPVDLKPSNLRWVGGSLPQNQRWPMQVVQDPSGPISDTSKFCAKKAKGALAFKRCNVKSTFVYGSKAEWDGHLHISYTGPFKTLDKVCHDLTGSSAVRIIKN